MPTKMSQKRFFMAHYAMDYSLLYLDMTLFSSMHDMIE